ncbi:acyl-CoA desaturase [Marinicella rhabdoformis]|uniref:acyl-CoA desaturase n=1 Tax=Marinicella rhabdoformis TaxID=2580566 RepID=UPI0012AED4A6|nr:acyl-CoA desaturase [Marinicella rhabdoformis]
MLNFILNWFDNEKAADHQKTDEGHRIDLSRIIPFIAMHVACLAVFYVGYSHAALIVMVVSYVLRMFAITAFFHRFFSHKAFKTFRWVQVTFAVIGTTATQRGPLWWAAHHRRHHSHADTEADVHTPSKGFWESHVLWFLRKQNFQTDHSQVKDLAKVKSLYWIDRYDMVFPVLYGALLYVVGSWVATSFPSLGTSGGQFLVWGYFISTVLLAHVTFSINSLAHLIGTRDYRTKDDSRNNFVLAILTLGEGWHNNHHCAPGSIKQGFKPWQIDLSFYALKLMEWCGLIWDVKYPNQQLLNNKLIKVNP